MNFTTYLDQAWTDHATQSERVASEFGFGTTMIETNEQLNDFAWLITHVMGEHLGRWAEGVSLLSNLKKHKALIKSSDTEKALHRHIATLQIGEGQTPIISSFSNSDQVRINAVAASALCGMDVVRSHTLLKKALDIAETSLDQKDPANRSLAVTGNNLACALEEKANRTNEETELMIFAAKTGRKFWEIAGTWLEVSRAEYRLAMTYLQADNIQQALHHALTCIEMCRQNNAGPLDMFYAYEAIAQVEVKRQNDLGFKTALQQAESFFQQLSEDDKTWCQTSLDKLKK